MHIPGPVLSNRRGYWPLVALIPAVGFGAAALTSPKPHVHTPSVEHVNLEPCASSLDVTRTIEVISGAPRGPALSPSWIARNDRAACRAQIQDRLRTAVISDEERLALVQWAAAEDALTNEVSLITTFYAGSPNADLYPDARQLWREYDRAFKARQIALADWRLAVQ